MGILTYNFVGILKIQSQCYKNILPLMTYIYYLNKFSPCLHLRKRKNFLVNPAHSSMKQTWTNL